MKVKCFFDSWIVKKRGVAAFVIPPFIFFAKKQKEVTSTLVKHEMIHIQQAEELGCLNFIYQYVVEYFKNGMLLKNKFEKEAYMKQYDPFTKKELRMLFRYWPNGL